MTKYLQLHIPYLTLMQCLVLVELMFFGVFMAWDAGLLPDMLASDNTRLSIIILLVFFLACLHCLERSFFLSRQFKVLHAHLNTNNSSDFSYASPVRDYLHESSLVSPAGDDEKDISIMAEVLAERICGQHQVGWFATGALIKLGLLGTVVGFMLMLGSLDNIKSMDLEQVQTLMQTMTQGMKIALNTTLLGLGSSLLLGIQYLYLDRCADQLIVQTIQCSQQNNRSGITVEVLNNMATN